jgi:hypothetical protein
MHQIYFGRTNLNVNSENIIGIKLSKGLYHKKEPLRKELTETQGVQKVVFSQFHPGSSNSIWEQKLATGHGEKIVSFQILRTEPGLFDLLGIDLVAGRYFKENNVNDIGKIILNEAAVREFDIENPLEAKIQASPDQWMEVVGVVEDFHFKAKHHEITPLVIEHRPYASWCYVKFAAVSFIDLHRLTETIRKKVSALAPAFPIEIEFMDESIRALYQEEMRFVKQFMFFALSAIALSCLGLLGLAIFSAQRRTKEICIRKVVGASVLELIFMVSKDFTKWVLLANLIAWPVAWYAMSKWLQNFAYRIDLTIWPFLLSGLAALAIALITVSWQAVRAATTNPVEALRYE